MTLSSEEIRHRTPPALLPGGYSPVTPFGAVILMEDDNVI